MVDVSGNRFLRRARIVIAFALGVSSVAGALVPVDASAAEAAPLHDSILVYAGRMSTTDLANSMAFNLNYRSGRGQSSFDNDTVGVVFQRELWAPMRELVLGVDAGVDDRFGHYLVCCLALGDRAYPDATVRSASRVDSFEGWVGVMVREPDIALGVWHVSPALTVGLSDVARTIGRERQREIDARGNAHLLGYVAPELAWRRDGWNGWEVVLRVPHRSGADGTFGHMHEGYNADTLGVRRTF